MPKKPPKTKPAPATEVKFIPAITSPLELERNEVGMLIPKVAGVAIEGLTGVIYTATAQGVSLQLYFDPSMVNFSTARGEEKPTLH